MLVQDAMRYQATPVRPSKKADLRVISEMPKGKILWFLIRKCRVGLLSTATIVLLPGFISAVNTWYDIGQRIFWLFF